MAYCCMLDNRAQVDEIDKKDYQKFIMGGHGEKNESLARQTSGQEPTTSWGTLESSMVTQMEDVVAETR